jgi:hypothetical protein
MSEVNGPRLLDELWEHCRDTVLPQLEGLTVNERHRNLFLQGATALYILLDHAYARGKLVGVLTRNQIVQEIIAFAEAEDAAGRTPKREEVAHEEG